MYGQGNYAPQFRQGPPTHPPQFQQGTPPFQQGPPPPPPPPLVNQQIGSAAPPHVVQPTHHHSIYQQGPPPPLPRPSQPYLHPHPPRVFLPSHSQGQMLYVNPRHLPPPSIGQGSQYRQLVPPPPPPPSFVPVTPAPFASIPQASSVHAHPPSMPPPSPPPPPPPPSSPPPLLPSPPASASYPEFSNKSSSSPSSIHLIASSSMPHNLDRACTSDDLPARGDYPTVHGGISCDMSTVEDRVSFETRSPSVFPPCKPAAEEVARQIEVLCHYIAKNGPAFEVTARRKEHGNPKFSFLFGGEPGSEAAIAYNYFQWMKGKCLAEFKLRNESEQKGSPLRPLEAESSKYLNRFTDHDASRSPGDSDMDMEDDTSQLNKDHGIGTSVELPKETISMYNLKDQQHENQFPTDKSTSWNASSRIESTSDITISAKNKREYDQITLGSSAEASECNLDACIQKSMELVDDLTQPKASPPAAYKDNVDPDSKIVSPFRLIQDYASDDSVEADDGARFEDVSPERVSPSSTVGNTNLHEDEGTKLDTNTLPFSTSFSEKRSTSLTASSSICGSRTMGTETTKVVEAIHVAPGSMDVSAKNSELQNDNRECRYDLVHKNSSKGDSDTSSKFQREGETQDSAALKVDEFGRMVRDDVNNSDSDLEHYKGRRYRRGRSRSPLDRRRRRSRSPRRRYEKRNRSRSWSPRKRRSVSKSRSPSDFRNTGDFSGDKMRRDRDKRSECYDFSKGRCRRGASCRYLHRGSGTDDAARRYRGRQQQHVEAPQDLRKSEDNIARAKYESVTMEEDITRTKTPWSDVTVSSSDVSRERGLDEKMDEVPLKANSQSATSVGIVQSATTVVAKVGHSDFQEAIEQGIEVQQVQKMLKSQSVQDNDVLKLSVEMDNPLVAAQPPTGSATRDISGTTPSSKTSFEEIAVCRVSQDNIPNGKVLETRASAFHGEHSLHSQNTRTTLPFPHENVSSQHPAEKQFNIPYYSGGNYQFQHSQLPPPPPLVTAQVSQPLSDHNLPPVATNVYSQSASVENRPLYQAPANDQYSQSSAPSKHAWTSLPPPPAYVQGSTFTAVSQIKGFHPMQFQQHPIPLMRPYQHGVSSHSQSSESRPPSFPPTGEFRGPALSTEGTQNQPFEDPTVHKDERFSHPSVLDGNRFPHGLSQVSSMHSQNQIPEEHHGSLRVHDGSPNFQTLPNQGYTSYMSHDKHTEAVPFAKESTVKQLHTILDGNSHRSKEDYGTPAANYSFMQQQYQPSFGMQWSGASNFTSHLGSVDSIGPSISKYPMLDDGKLSHLSVPGGSRISAHFNPFASTFDNVPDSSKYHSNFKPVSLVNPTTRYDSLPRIQASPSDSNLSGVQSLRKSGDPYDPLYDSVEPSLKSSRMSGCVEGGNLTNVVLRESGAAESTNSLTGSKKQIEAVTAERTSSPENDEFGETAIDAEAGVMESGSPDNLNDIGDKAMGDVEIDQVQSKGKSNKGKDSRSMKLFKVALADFVKDLLKPSWRQGNMSKEAFKTIVKKTVDKVAGAMKNPPKGHAKINQYVESSQRKLTKLVMGYVDKYVKA